MFSNAIPRNLAQSSSRKRNMPKKTKILPDDRAEWTFGALLFWHLFMYGTRPDGDPGRSVGRVWNSKQAVFALGKKSANALWNWIDDRNYPYDTQKIEEVLFGDSTRFGPWRQELQRKLAEGRARLEAAKAGDLEEPEASSPAIEIIPPGAPAPVAGIDLVPVGRDEPEDDDHGGDLLPVIWKPAPATTYRPKPDGFRKPYRKGSLTIGEAIRIKWRTRQKSPPPPPPPAGTTDAPSYRAYAVTGVAAAFVLAAAYVSTQRLRPVQPAPTQEKAEVPKPMETSVVAQAPKPPEVSPPVQTSKPLTDEDKRQEEDRRVRMAAIVANEERQKRQAADERQAAIDRDAAHQRAEAAQRERDDTARRLSGLGFRLIENNTLRGQSMAPIQTESVADCALACLREGCDGFAYAQSDEVTELRKGRRCVRFKGGDPQFEARPGYSAGKRSDRRLGARFAANDNVVTDAPLILTQSSTPPMDADGVIQCPNGPVKVSGYNITCDAYLGGGTALGSAQLVHSVNTINDCSAKCAAIRACTAFTFNAADQPGKRRCEIFGGKPEARTVGGWVSGER